MIKEITICLHCGCCHDIVYEQMKALKPLEKKYKVFWNNRINRHPDSYDSYSEMINEAIVTSPTEYVVLINDRTKPKDYEVIHMISLLENGFAASTKYSLGFIAFSKQLIRKIGWFDERFYGGGYEDDDFVLRLRLANLAYYESEESNYDKSWLSPLRPEGGEGCKKSGPFFQLKWKTTSNEIKRVLKEEDYIKYRGKLGADRPDIELSWKDWSHSELGIRFKERMINNDGGCSRTHHFLRDDYKTEYRKVTSI